jgi:hypothetical protein
VILVLAGSGRMWLGDDEHRLTPHVLALAPRGIARSIAAGRDGITYVTVHRRREPMGIGRAPATRHEADAVADE